MTQLHVYNNYTTIMISLYIIPDAVGKYTALTLLATLSMPMAFKAVTSSAQDALGELFSSKRGI